MSFKIETIFNHLIHSVFKFIYDIAIVISGILLIDYCPFPICLYCPLFWPPPSNNLPTVTIHRNFSAHNLIFDTKYKRYDSRIDRIHCDKVVIFV